MSEAGRSLDQRLLDAHARNDPVALSVLYTEAADVREAAGDIDAACFYLTHAYVYALQAGAGTAAALQLRLWAHGREERPESSAPCIG